jgi:hypothetical protein
LANQAGKDIGATAGSNRDYDTHRPRRIGLRPCDARRGWQSGSTRYKIQKSATWEFHCALLARRQGLRNRPSAPTCAKIDFFGLFAPADGTLAPRFRNYGTSRWQLSKI